METKTHQHAITKVSTEKFLRGHIVSKKTEKCFCGAVRVTVITTMGKSAKLSHWWK